MCENLHISKQRFLAGAEISISSQNVFLAGADFFTYPNNVVFAHAEIRMQPGNVVSASEKGFIHKNNAGLVIGKITC
jgi:hypothetical protein